MNKKWLLVILLIASVSFNFVLLTLPESPEGYTGWYVSGRCG